MLTQGCPNAPVRGKKRLFLIAFVATILFYGVPLPKIPIAAWLFDEEFHEDMPEGTVISMPTPELEDGLTTGAACPTIISPDASTIAGAPPALDPADSAFDTPDGGPDGGKDAQQQVVLAEAPCIIEDMVSAGDTLSRLLDPYIGPGELQEFIQVSKPFLDITNLRIGKTYRITTINDRLQQFVYERDGRGLFIVERKDDEFVAGHIPIIYDVKTEALAGDIQSSLLGAMHKIGEKPEIALRLADMFASDVDFIRDIRKGDSFRVLVKKRYLHDKHVGYSDILAAEFTNQGNTHQGYFFTDSDGRSDYYDADGNSLRKSFLRSPLAFTRVTSGFNMRRKHPITGKIRPHPAIDYGAPTGTPVMAVCEGTVRFRGWGNGAGNYIKLDHPQGYESMYLHLSKFAKGLKKGRKVRQGEVIGYVGSTGMSTGPHLDFRMKRNGKWINPTKMVNIKGKQLAQKYMDAFKKTVQQHSAKMQSGFALQDDSATNYKVAQAQRLP